MDDPEVLGALADDDWEDEQDDGIRKRPFGRFGATVSELTLGTWGLSGDASGPVYDGEVDRVIDRAMEVGVTLYDTADIYGEGAMERKLGERLDAERHRICTKIGTDRLADPPQKKFSAEFLGRALEGCHERQRRDRLDVVLLHNPSVSALEGDGPDLLTDEVRDGRVEHWGVSCVTAEVATKAIQRGAMVVMMPFHLLFQREVQAAKNDVESVEVAFMARSVLSHGLLVGHWSRNKVFFDNDHRKRRWTKETLRYRLGQLDAVRSLVGGDVQTLRAGALRFVLEHYFVSTAVIGPRTLTQLNQLVHEAGDGPPYLDYELFTGLPARLEAVGVEL